LTAFGVAVWPATVRAVELPPAGHFTLWQLPSQTKRGRGTDCHQMMSYVIQGPTGRVAVIDGGWVGDAPYLKEFLRGLGGHVDDWFISHQHADHIGALTAILQKPDGTRVDRIHASLLSERWIRQVNFRPGADELEPAMAFNAAIKASGNSVTRPALGDETALDGLKFQILQVSDESGWTKNMNEQCMVVRLSTPGTSVLFLVDLGTEGGKRLLAGKLADKLPSEYVQMAHHGNWAVGWEVYEAVKAKYALWPTPNWLWDAPLNNRDRFDTAVYRQWMKELGIQEDYVMKDGLIRLDLPLQKPVAAPAQNR
jgi:beta-lactamase superfamily II metal-dependent hydrolase